MLFTILGIAICAAVLIQLSLFAAGTLAQLSYNRRQYAVSRRLMEKQIAVAGSHRQQELEPGDAHTWKGFREFVVDRVVKETEVCTSVYLKPVDGKPIPVFRPGQHLTFKIPVPGESKPLIRCYSISDGPGKDAYRITVKAIPSPPNQPDLPAGKASNFINNELMVGDRLEVKAPSGSFFVDEKSKQPIVLLAGGIGITPMISMLEALIESKSQRLIVLAYGVQNAADQAFKDYLKQVNETVSNIHVVKCCAEPNPTDKIGEDYHIQGFVSVQILQHLLPDNKCLFYLCGPPPFMQSLYSGLQQWGVPETRINYEAFGPATIKKALQEEPPEQAAANLGVEVRFAASEKTISWDASHDSLLDFAEENDVVIDSGCRAGSCGTCATSLVSGKVKYPEGMEAECEPGQCLVCIAQPDGAVELDA